MNKSFRRNNASKRVNTFVGLLSRGNTILPYSFCHTILFGILLAATSGIVRADDLASSFQSAHGDFFHLLRREQTDLQLNYLFEKDHKEDGGVGEFDLQQVSFATEAPQAITRDAYVRVSGNYTARFYDFKDNRTSATRLSDDIWHKAVLGVGAGNFFSEDLLLTGIAYFGAYSDFDHDIDTNDFNLSGNGIVAYRINPGTELVGGVQVGEEFENASVYPLLGIRILSTDGKIGVTLTLPVEFSLSYNISPKAQLYVMGSATGDCYRVTAGNQEKEFDAISRDRRIGIGAEIWAFSQIRLGLEGGVSMGSELEFKTHSPGQFSGDLKTAGYATASLGVAF